MSYFNVGPGSSFFDLGKLPFLVTGCVELCLTNHWLIGWVPTAKGKVISAGICGGVSEAKTTGNTGISPEMQRENTGSHSLPAHIIAIDYKACSIMILGQASVEAPAPTAQLPARDVLPKFQLHLAVARLVKEPGIARS